MDQLSERVHLLEERADRADVNRQEIESRLLDKLTAIHEAIKGLTSEIQRQGDRNALQDQDLERLKEQVHQWLGEAWRKKAKQAGVGLAGLTTVVWGVLELALRYYQQ